MRTARRVRAPVVIAGDLRGSCDALVAGPKRALFIPFAISAIKPRRLSRPCDAVCNRGEEPSELIKRAHIYSVFFWLQDRPRSSASVRGLALQCVEPLAALPKQPASTHPVGKCGNDGIEDRISLDRI